jgi:hypothetical protein
MVKKTPGVGRILVTMRPEVKLGVIALAKEAGVPVAKLLGQWISDLLPQLHAVTMAAKAARAGRPESAIKILDGLAAQQTEQLELLSGVSKAKIAKGKKK